MAQPSTLNQASDEFAAVGPYPAIPVGGKGGGGEGAGAGGGGGTGDVRGEGGALNVPKISKEGYTELLAKIKDNVCPEPFTPSPQPKA